MILFIINSVHCSNHKRPKALLSVAFSSRIKLTNHFPFRVCEIPFYQSNNKNHTFLGWFLSRPPWLVSQIRKKGSFFFLKSRSNRCRFSAKDNWDTKGRNTPCAKEKSYGQVKLWNKSWNFRCFVFKCFDQRLDVLLDILFQTFGFKGLRCILTLTMSLQAWHQQFLKHLWY